MNPLALEMDTRYVVTAEELEAEARASIGHAIEAVERGDHATFKWLVPGVVSPQAQSNGACGTRRTIESIVKYWASNTGDMTLVNYLNNLTVRSVSPAP